LTTSKVDFDKFIPASVASADQYQYQYINININMDWPTGLWWSNKRRYTESRSGCQESKNTRRRRGGAQIVSDGGWTKYMVLSLKSHIITLL